MGHPFFMEDIDNLLQVKCLLLLNVGLTLKVVVHCCRRLEVPQVCGSGGQQTC